MADIASDIDAEITSDSTRLRVKWLSGTEHLSSSENDVCAFPNHAANRCRCCPSGESGEERPSRKIGVVLLEHGFAWHDKLHGNEFETSSLKSRNYLSNDSSLNTIGLDLQKKTKLKQVEAE